MLIAFAKQKALADYHIENSGKILLQLVGKATRYKANKLNNKYGLVSKNKIKKINTK